MKSFGSLRLIFDVFGLRPSRKLTASQRMTVSVWWSSAKNGRTRLESWQPEFVRKSLPESSYWSRIGRLSLCRMSANARRTWFKARNKFELWSHEHFCRMNCVCRRITRGKLRQADAQCSKCTCTRHQTGFRWLHIDADCWSWQSGCKWYRIHLDCLWSIFLSCMKLHEAGTFTFTHSAGTIPHWEETNHESGGGCMTEGESTVNIPLTISTTKRVNTCLVPSSDSWIIQAKKMDPCTSFCSKRVCTVSCSGVPFGSHKSKTHFVVIYFGMRCVVPETL